MAEKAGKLRPKQFSKFWKLWRRPPWKTTSLEEDQKSFDANSASMTITAEPELGTAQPQLVFSFSFSI
jgi:hypothetical protein